MRHVSSAPSRRLRALTPALMTVLALGATACGGDHEGDDMDDMDMAPAEAPTPMAADRAMGTIAIAEPEDGAEIDGGSVTVRLTSEGYMIRPAGDTTAMSGHHHVFLDTDVSAAGSPIPAIPGEVIHLGDGSSEYTFEGLAPGSHRLIAVLADGAHVPLQPWVVDTVTITVR